MTVQHFDFEGIRYPTHPLTGTCTFWTNRGELFPHSMDTHPKEWKFGKLLSAAYIVNTSHDMGIALRQTVETPLGVLQSFKRLRQEALEEESSRSNVAEARASIAYLISDGTIPTCFAELRAELSNRLRVFERAYGKALTLTP